MSEPKILLIADHIGIGGIPRYCTDLVKHQKDAKCKIVLAAFVTEEQNEKDFPEELGYPVLSYGPADIGVMENINRIINREKPDYILTQGYKSNIMTWLAFLRFRFKAKMITVQHGILFPMSGRTSIYFKTDIFLRRMLRVPTITVSHDTAIKLIDNWKIRRGLIRVLHNPIENSQKIREQNKVFTIGFASRLLKEKGIGDLLEALKMLKGKNKFRLLIAGDGPLLSDLEAYVNENNLKDEVVFLGSVKDMTGFYNKLDLFVFPSWGEGLPYVVLEAMAHKVAVVATKVGGIPEIIEDRRSGFLTKAKDVENLKNTIEYCMNSRSELVSVVENATRKISSHNFKRYYEKLLALINSFNNGK